MTGETPRFVLSSVTGVAIPGGKRIATAWSVLDRHVCYRIVVTFTPGQRRTSEVCEHRARVAAAALNAGLVAPCWDDHGRIHPLWLRKLLADPGRDAQPDAAV